MTVFRVRPGNGLLKPSGTGWKKIALPPDVSCSPVGRRPEGTPIVQSPERLPRGGGTKPSYLCKIPLPFAGRQPSGKDSLCARIFLYNSRTSSTAAGRRVAGVPGLAIIGCTAMTGEVRKTVSKSIGGCPTDGFKGKPHRMADCPPEERSADQLFWGFFLVICTV